MSTRRFPLRVVLTVTTGRLLTAAKDGGNGIEDLYDILSWMTNDDLMTHQLPRAGRECAPWLLRWFPELDRCWSETVQACFKVLLDTFGAAGIEQYLKQCHDIYGCKAEYDVPQIPADDHDRKDAFDELIEMRGTDEGIIIV